MSRQTAVQIHVPAVDGAQPSAAPVMPLEFDGPDARADDGRRRIAIEADRIVVERSIAGVRMRLALPLASYQGVAIAVTKRGQEPLVRVILTHVDRDFDVVLFEAGDDRDVTAEWQFWARRFGLPLLVAEHDGRLTQPFHHLGALVIERVRARRKGSILSGRRPRFLARRQTGHAGETARIHREREIIARS